LRTLVTVPLSEQIPCTEFHRFPPVACSAAIETSYQAR
jgi:hypothetical protein